MKVTGASSFGESLTISKNSNAVLGLIISNTTAGTNSNPYLQLVSDATAGSAQVFKYSSTRTAYKTIAASDFGHYNATAGDISFLNDFASGAIKFAAGGASTPHMTIKSNGNTILNSLTDDGVNRLQVSGSSRFNGNVLISGSGATSGTNGLLIQNSSAVSTFIVRNDGRVSNGDSSFYVDRYVTGGTVMTISTVGHNNAIGISVTSATAIHAYSNLGVSGNNLLGASIYAAGGASGGNISLGLLSNRALITSTASGMNMHTSSMLQVDSTVQGFLPPRMTTTQKNAITTPAAGLVVYDTTLAKLCVYTTGWETITSS
jgi:hypothetical protein